MKQFNFTHDREQKSTKKKFEIFILILILAVSLFLRLYKNNEIPPSLNWDEVSHGYNAYSILKTGRDEWGSRLPLIFRAYGDFKLPLYVYLTVISEVVFGLNVLAVRLVSVLSGVGLVALAYLLTKRITRSEIFSLFAAFLTALSPWSLFLSRIAVEANLGAFLFGSGMYFFICWWDSQKRKDLVLVFLFWGLSLFAYNSCRILVPICLLLVIFLAAKRQVIKQLLLPCLVFLIFLLPMIGQFFDRSAKARFDWVSLVDQGMINRIVQRRESSGLPKILSRTFFNRPTFFLFYSAKNYLSNLSPRYLFFRGGSHYQFSLPDHELLYLVIAPFLLLGLLTVFKKSCPKEKIIAAWFLLAFIPSAITRDAPHVLRSILVLPTPMILSALGLKWLVDKIGNRSIFKGQLIMAAIFLTLLVSFSRWWRDYQNIYPMSYSWAWQYGYKEVVGFIKTNYQNYNQIFFTKRYGEPHEFVAFYWPWNPVDFQQKKLWDYHANWYWVNKLDKFVFVNDWEVVGGVRCEVRSEKCLLVTSPGNYPEGWSKIKTINFLDGKPAFEILEK